MVLRCTPYQETLISLLYNISLAQGIILSSSFSLSSAYFSCYEDILLCPLCGHISYAFRVLYGPTLILTKNLSRMTNNFSWSFHMGSMKFLDRWEYRKRMSPKSKARAQRWKLDGNRLVCKNNCEESAFC